MAKLEHANLDVLTRLCGGRAITIIATGNSDGLQEYVNSTIWCINDLNQSEPATVHSVYGGSLEYVIMELSEHALDSESERKVSEEFAKRYREEAKTSKLIIISNPWGNTQLARDIKLISDVSGTDNRYVHHVFIDYRELRNAILMGESSGADYKFLDTFRSNWSKIREYADSYAEVFRDPPVSDSRVREYTVDLNLNHLVSISTQVREALRLQDVSRVIKLYPDLRSQLSKKEKILAVWVGSSEGIIEELSSLEAAQFDVWEFWGSREPSSIIPQLLQSVSQTNTLVQELQTAEENAKAKVAEVRERVLARNSYASPQEAIKEGNKALDLVETRAKAIKSFTESTFTDWKNREALDSGYHIGETWNHIDDPTKCGHVITSDVKHNVDLTSDYAQKQADRALGFAEMERTTLQLLQKRKR